MALRSKTKLLDGDYINSVIFAKFSIATLARLFRQVLQTRNTRNPYDTFNSSSVYLQDGICTKRFRKEFGEETGLGDEQLYIEYQRRVPDSGFETTPWTHR